MKYTGMPAGMWKIFKRSFRKALITDLSYDAGKASEIMKKACPRYKEIIGKLPEFEKEDRFKTNILSCAMFVSVLLSVDRRPTLQEAADYYEHAMTTKATKWFCRKAGKTKFSEKDIETQKKTAALRAGDRNPYSWNMEYLPYEDGSGYEARFTTCGICVLMREYGFGDMIPAMCHLDYTMSEMGGASEFVREYTLAGGGPYCDCGYKKKKDGEGEKQVKKRKRSFSDNFGNPQGLLGRMMLTAMDKEHLPMAEWSFTQFEFPAQGNVLDIGCGGGYNIKRMLQKLPKGKIVGLDISEESVRKAKKVNKEELGKRVKILQGSVEKMPFKDERLDLVTAFETVFFWPDVESNITEVYRIVKPGGQFVVINNYGDPKIDWEKKVPCMKRHTAEEIGTYMENAGFRDVRISKKDNLFCVVGVR